MDWITILSLIGTLLGGAGITQIINWGAQKRKANLENKQIEVNTDSTAVETLKDAIAEIRTSNDHFQEIDREKEEKILKLQEDLLKKEKDLSIIKSYVCSHLGCGSRCPLREQAETWIEDLKNNKAHVDYNPMFCTVYKIANEDDDDNEKN